MRLTEATSSDPAVLTGFKLAPSRETDSATSQFASVLSATRRSSNRLLDLLKTQSQARQEAAKQQEHPAEDRADERVEESPKKGARRERTDRPRRSEQLRSKARDRAKTAEPAEQRSEERHEQTVEKDQPAERRPEQRPAVLPTGDAVVTVTNAPLPPIPQPASVEPQGQGSVGGSVPASSAAVPAVAPTVGGDLPASTPAVQGRVATGSAEAIKPVSPAGTGVGAENTAGGKPAEAAAPATTTGRAGGSEGEFKSLLQHLSRTRVGEPMPAAGSLPKTKAATGRTEKPLDMESAETVHDLARVVRSRIGPRQSSMTMTMSPAELGRLRIDVRTDDGALTVRFQTETAAGHDAIKAKLNELRGALEQQGIQVDRIDVQYAPPAPPVNHGGQGHGQPTPDGGQWQTPSGYGGSAGQAGQSFDQPRHEAAGSSFAGQETGAGEPPADANVPWNWLRPGVDLVA